MRKLETINENGESHQVHRTLLKLIMNPILTKFGWIIVSVFDERENFIKYEIRKYPDHIPGPFKVWFKIRF